VFAESYLTRTDLESCLRENAFFNYAAQNWAYHIQDIQQSVGDLALKFLIDDRKASTSSQALFLHPRPRFHGMHLGAYFGLNDNIMLKLLEEKDRQPRCSCTDLTCQRSTNRLKHADIVQMRPV
jgi:hypothetical protein